MDQRQVRGHDVWLLRGEIVIVGRRTIVRRPGHFAGRLDGGPKGELVRHQNYVIGRIIPGDLGGCEGGCIGRADVLARDGMCRSDGVPRPHGTVGRQSTSQQLIQGPFRQDARTPSLPKSQSRSSEPD